MADRRRKGMAAEPTINCRVKAETKLFLIEEAGEFGIGYALDRLVEEVKSSRARRSSRRRNAPLTQPQVATI